MNRHFDQMRRHAEHNAERHAARHAERRRRLTPEVRRAELIEAGLNVLRNQDPGTVRVEDVTRQAGAAKGTFYLYFSSWTDLLVAIRDHVVSEYTAQMFDRFAVVGNAPNWWAAFEKECANFLDFQLELGTLHKAIFHGYTVECALESSDQSLDRIIARLLRQGIALGACRQVDPDLAAPLIFALLHSTADSVMRSESQDERRLETLLTLLRAWLQIPQEQES